jgi:integrase
VKTSSGRRAISLSDKDIELLQEQKHQQEKMQANSVPYRDLNLVFALDNGNPIPRKNLIKSLKLSLKEAGITKPFTFHSLRRTSATLIYLKDPNIRMIQERLGHSEVRTTLSYYTGVVPGHQAQAASNLANLLFDEDRV